ncbi:MAG: nucleotidyltransferase domain-containing protein [Anaerolineae bacterium]
MAKSDAEEPAFDRDELVTRLRKALAVILKDRPVKLAYLYGSAATGCSTPLSDVDIALVVDRGLEPLEHLHMMLQVADELADACDVRNTDVRIINNAPLVFRGRVVCDDILLYTRDETVRIEFETTTRDEYFDYLPIHRRLQAAFFARIRERGLHG